ncbi:MAG: hypothetical protein ACT4PJ_16275 [Gemmatimonadaceae bacterium]
MRSSAVALLATIPLGLPLSAHGQGDASPRAVSADSATVRRDAERSARRFEQRRLTLLPNIPSSVGGTGDIIIGRYRYAAGEADDTKPPPAEPVEIAELRRSLLATLGSAVRVAPADAWLRSRFVWYSIEAGDTTAAVEAARECRDDEVTWWCDALLGLALHVSHKFVPAEESFRRALATMPDSTRCRWTDVESLLDGDAENLIERTPCDERRALNERLWWLADPLHSIDGNELRSEHFARRAFAVLHDRWRASHPLGWGNDMREIVVRYAWPVAWSRDRMDERSPTQGGFSMALTGHEPNPAYDFFPDADALESPYDASDGNWHLRRPRASAHYAHPFAAPLRSVRHQIAQLRRGDSLLVVAAWDATDDTLFSDGVARAALVLSRDDGRYRELVRSDTSGSRGVLTVRAPIRDHLASLELFAAKSRAAARARSGLRGARFTDDIAVSDILLLSPGERPRTFDEVLQRLLPDGRLGENRQVTLYWEIYGVAIEAPRVTVTVSRVRASFGRRLAERLGLRDEPQTVEMHWETDAPASHSTAGSVTLDLRDRPTGTWRISVSVTAAGRTAAGTSRNIVIED